MRLALVPPMLVNAPPANSAPPLPSSNTSVSLTKPSAPPSRSDQFVPSQRATEPAGRPPAIPKVPPTNSAGPWPSSKAVSVFVGLPVPG
jgi:hypothetical protein